jgi:hypothetical protein
MKKDYIVVRDLALLKSGQMIIRRVRKEPVTKATS